MDLDQARDFVRGNSRAVLTTLRKDGTPQLSPVLVALAGDLVVVSTQETAYKTRNLRRDPRAWLCVLPDGFFGSWVQLAGTVRVRSLPDALEPLVDYYRAVAGEHPDWAAYRAAMVSEQRCLLEVSLTSAGPDQPV